MSEIERLKKENALLKEELEKSCDLTNSLVAETLKLSQEVSDVVRLTQEVNELRAQLAVTKYQGQDK